MLAPQANIQTEVERQSLPEIAVPRPIGARWRLGRARAAAQMPRPAFSALVFIYIVIRKSFSDPVRLHRRGLVGYIAKAVFLLQETMAWI
jgi:hypothetical protein